MPKSTLYLLIAGVVVVLLLFIIQSQTDINSVFNGQAGKRTATPARQDLAGPAQERARRIESLQAALTAAEAELAEKPDSYEALVTKGNSYFDLGDLYNVDNHELAVRSYAAAKSSYLKALAINPKDANVIVDLGICFRETHEPEKAIEHFEKALQIEPNHANAIFNTGVVQLYDLKDSKAALAAWVRFLELAPDDPRAAEIKERIAVLKTELAKNSKSN